MGTVRTLWIYCTEWNLCRIYTEYLSVQAWASYFALTCFPTPKKLLSYLKILNLLSWGWSPTESTWHGGHWLAYCSLPQVIMMMENLVEWILAAETEVLGENPFQCHFVYHRSHLTRPGIELVGSQRLTAWAMAWPHKSLECAYINFRCRFYYWF
jgi:hypothetical protein